MNGHFLKDPAAVVDFSIYWGFWLADGDTVTAAEWTVPEGITLDSSAINAASVSIEPNNSHGSLLVCPPATLATAWLSGGTAGTAYRVACRITTAQGRTDERSITIRCANR
jgi:hypothetical protein